MAVVAKIYGVGQYASTRWIEHADAHGKRDEHPDRQPDEGCQEELSRQVDALDGLVAEGIEPCHSCAGGLGNEGGRLCIEVDGVLLAVAAVHAFQALNLSETRLP